MKKGFTLIELLAVIVILAIIALIATPIVLSIIEETKESATIRSTEYYLDAVEQSIMKKNLTAGGSFSPNTCEVQDSGNLLCDDVDTLEVEVNGEVPSSGTITFDKGKIVNIELTIGNKILIKNEKGELFSHVIPDKICSKNPNPVVGSVASGSYTAGDEYICKVNEDTSYNFMIVNSNEEYIYLMVMNEPNDVYSTFGSSPWVSKEDFIKAGGTEELWNSTVTTYPDQVGKYTYGPITALEKLDEITKDWYYIAKLNEYYTDTKGNYTIYLSGRARLYSFSDTIPNSYYDYFAELLENSNFWVMDTISETMYFDVLGYGYIWTYRGWEYDAMAYDASSLQKIVPVIKVPKSKMA